MRSFEAALAAEQGRRDVGSGKVSYARRQGSPMNLSSYLRIERPSGRLAVDTENLRPHEVAGGSNTYCLVGVTVCWFRTSE